MQPLRRLHQIARRVEYFFLFDYNVSPPNFDGEKFQLVKSANMIGLMLLTPPLRGRMSGIALSCHGQPFILLLVAKLLLKMITQMMRSLITVSLRRTLINGSLMEIIKVRIIICSSNNITSKMIRLHISPISYFVCKLQDIWANN